MLCYATAHDINETTVAKNLTEKLIFNCGQVIKKFFSCTEKKERKIIKLCIPEVMLRCIAF